jgi:hypothetical protein
MLLALLMDNVWLAIALWVALYCLDYIFTLRAARSYQGRAGKHFSFGGGYELNPFFKDDIAQLRRFSFRFFLMMFFIGGLLLIIHSMGIPEAFALIWGMLVSMQVVVHFRHLRNLALFHYASASRGIEGRIVYQHWLSLRLSAVEFLSFATLFLFIFLLGGNYIALGGALGCFSMSVRHLLDSRKKGTATSGPPDKLG